MKKNNNNLGNMSIKICPVCGFSFKPYDPKTKKKIVVCPMCGHTHKPDEFDKKFF